MIWSGAGRSIMDRRSLACGRRSAREPASAASRRRTRASYSTPRVQPSSASGCCGIAAKALASDPSRSRLRNSPATALTWISSLTRPGPDDASVKLGQISTWITAARAGRCQRCVAIAGEASFAHPRPRDSSGSRHAPGEHRVDAGDRSAGTEQGSPRRTLTGLRVVRTAGEHASSCAHPDLRLQLRPLSP